MRKLIPTLLLSFCLFIAAALLLTGPTSAQEPEATPNLEPTPAPPRIDPLLLPKIEPQLLKKLLENETEAVPFIVYLKAKADLSAAAPDVGGQAEPDPLTRRTAVVNALQETARNTQFGVLQTLLTPPTDGVNSQGAAATDIQPLWIVNAIAAKGALEMVSTLAARPDVEVIRLDKETLLARLAGNGADSLSFSTRSCSYTHPSPCLPGLSSPSLTPNFESPEWGIAKIRADLVHNALEIDGSGVVVANIDSGVDWLHPALQAKYRGYTGAGHLPLHIGNWFDATGEGAIYPVDGNGHGTHTMGTMVGDNGIGVAPGAQWIAVRAFSSSGTGLNSWIHAAFQWVMAPEGEPALAPDIVNNSWGSSSGTNTEFEPDVQALLNAGIFPVFSAGNNGPYPGTVGAPGSFDISFAVGATTIDDQIASFSSRGPSPWGQIKPEVSAPGKDVLSSLPGGTYGVKNGTSMAAPHAAGLAALLLQASPVLSNNLDDIAVAMMSTATPLGSPIPNNDYGWGRIDAYNAVMSVATVGTMQGTVTQTEGGPINGATVQMTRLDLPETTVYAITDDSGAYLQGLAPGTYDATAWAFGYEPASGYNLPITTGATTIQDFSLQPKPEGVIFGTVREAGTNNPLVAAISIDGTPAGTTSDTYGNFALTLPTGTYNITVVAPQHRVGKAFNITIYENAGIIQNFWLDPAPSILLVDSGLWYQESQIGYYQQALDELLYTYNTWQISEPFGTPNDIPTASDLARYDIVIWSSPADSPGYVGAGEAVESFLDGGGKLLLSGQDVAYYDGGGSLFAAAPYFKEYLKAKYAQADSEIYTAFGLNNEPFYGLSVTLTGGDGADNQTTPDIVDIADPDFAGPLLGYDEESLAGLHVGLCVPYRAMFLAFGFEAINSSADRREVMERTIDWLVDTPSETGVELTPAAETLIGNFGSVVSHTVRVRNTGTTSDTYHLSYDSHWPVTMSPNSDIFLAPCQTTEFTFGVTISTAEWHISDTLTATITSTHFVTVTDTATRTTKSPAPVLLVDDDRWYSFAAEYRQALETNHIPYDYWLVPKSWSGPVPSSPPLETLQMYPMTVWYTAYDWFQPLTPQEEDRLVSYLNYGGRLLFSSQDYLYQLPDIEDSVFGRHYLGIQDHSEDFTSDRVAGEPGNPVGDYLGPYALTFPPGYRNRTDVLTPTSTAKIASRGQYDQPNGLTNARVLPWEQQWRTNFLAYGLELLAPPERARFMQRALGWLSWLGSSTVTPSSSAVASGATVTYTATIVNDGWDQLATATFTATRPPELTWGTFSTDLQRSCEDCDLVWTGSLAQNERKVFTYTATVTDSLPVGTVIKQTSWLAYPEHNILFDRIATVRVNFPDLSNSTMSVVPTEAVESGDTLTYTITLRNEGLEDAPMVTTTNRLPYMLELISVDRPSRGTVLSDTNGITWTTPLSEAGMAILTFRAVISYQTGPAIQNRAYADDGFNEPVELTARTTFRTYPTYLPLITKNN